LFEGLKAYKKTDGAILLFRPEENALRMRIGAERMCMPAPSVEQFVDAVKQTVLANKRWVSSLSESLDSGYSFTANPSTDAHGLIVYQIFILTGASYW
jgi:branched-subunit amino acid aminotransferase/4-amino-4-deoxychorismate lyase